MKQWISPALLLALSLPLMAAQGKVFQDTTGSISVYGLEPGASVRVGIDSPPDRDVTSNNCGLVVISPSQRFPMATVQIDGQVINPANLPIQLRPNCRPKTAGGHALDEDRSQHFISTNGDLIVVGKRPSTRYSVTYPGQLKMLTRRVNACGFLRVQETSSINFNQSILLPTTSSSTYAEFQISNLPQAKPLLCYRERLYLPQPWVDIFAEAIPGSEVAKATAESAAALPSALAPGGNTGGTGGGSGNTGSTGGSGNTGSGSTGGSTGGAGSTGSGSTGSGSTGGSTGGTGSTGGSTGGGSTGGSTGGGSTGGSNSPPSGIHAFTAASYNPKLHDYNGDNLIDDANGDGTPDDRDGDGHPDGPWGSNDIPRSAGPGLTVPLNASYCLGFNGNLVAASNSFRRGTTYYMTADDGLPPSMDDPTAATAGGAVGGAPVLRYEGNFRSPGFSHTYEDGKRMGYILNANYDELDGFYWSELPPCLVPPWLTNPPSWISQGNEPLRVGLVVLEDWGSAIAL
jgi:hypothetical protein